MFRFTDHAVLRCDEEGFELHEVITALEAGHFKQRDLNRPDRFVHYVHLSGERAKVVTGTPSLSTAELDDGDVIITAFRVTTGYEEAAA